MIGKCAEAVINWLVECRAIDEMDKELYQYALYSILLSVSPIFLTILFGIGMGCVWQSFVIIIPFTLIRKFSGGYHTKNSLSCLAGSGILLLLCIWLSLHIAFDYLTLMLTAVAVISLSCFSPISNENRELDNEERKYCKKVTIVLAVVFMLVEVFLFLCRLYTYSLCISIGIMLSAGLQIPCIAMGWGRKLRVR